MLDAAMLNQNKVERAKLGTWCLSHKMMELFLGIHTRLLKRERREEEEKWRSGEARESTTRMDSTIQKNQGCQAPYQSPSITFFIILSLSLSFF